MRKKAIAIGMMDNFQENSAKEPEKRQTHPARRSLLRKIPLLRHLVHEQLEIAPELAEFLREIGLDTFDGVWRYSSAKIATQHADRSVVELDIPDNGVQRRFFLKRLSRSRLKHIIEALLAFERPVSKSMREWRFAHKLNSLGIGTAAMAAAGEVRFAGFPLESFLIVEAQANAVTLDTFLAEVHNEDAQTAERKIKAVTKSLAETIGKMHQRGIFHQDL